jgi:hypothetical protein
MSASLSVGRVDGDNAPGRLIAGLRAKFVSSIWIHAQPDSIVVTSRAIESKLHDAVNLRVQDAGFFPLSLLYLPRSDLAAADR